MENKIKQGSTHTFPLPPKNNNKPGFKKWIKYIWTGLAAVVLGIAFLFFAISQGTDQSFLTGQVIFAVKYCKEL